MRWVFVVGCYNSGTTLLERMLRRHPCITGLSTEGQLLTEALISPKDVGVPRMWAMKESLFRFPVDSNVDVAAQVKQDWLRQLDDPDRPIAIEKTPTNSARTRWLQQQFPGACFIYIVRNGYAVSLGIRDKVRQECGIRDGLLHDAAFQWSRNCEVMLEDRKYLNSCFELTYEALSEDPIGLCSSICSFLEIDKIEESQLIEPYQVHGQFSRIENQNHVRIDSMLESEKKLIDDVAGPMLECHGYL